MDLNFDDTETDIKCLLWEMLVCSISVTSMMILLYIAQWLCSNYLISPLSRFAVNHVAARIDNQLQHPYIPRAVQ